MSCMNTYKLACLVAVLALALSACSKAPTVADVQEAIEESMLMSSRMHSAFTGEPMDEQVQVDRVDNCKARRNDSGYICDVESRVISRSGTMPTQRSIDSVELMKSDEGWILVD